MPRHGTMIVAASYRPPQPESLRILNAGMPQPRVGATPRFVASVWRYDENPLGALTPYAPADQNWYWVWADTPEFHDAATNLSGGTVMAYRAFTVNAASTTALFVGTCDNAMDVYLNGTKVGASTDWRYATSIANLTVNAGVNELCVKIWNYEAWGRAGFIGLLRVDGQTVAKTDARWNWLPLAP